MNERGEKIVKARQTPPLLWGMLVAVVSLAACAADDSAPSRNPIRTPVVRGYGGGAAGADTLAGTGGGAPGSSWKANAGRGVTTPFPGTAGTPGAAAVGGFGAAGRPSTGTAGIAGPGFGAAAGDGATGPTAGSGSAANTTQASAGAGGTDTAASSGETGRLVGITAAHNAVRAMVQADPQLPPLSWSPTLAAYAQEWADTLARTSCAMPHHRTSAELRAVGYGENLAAARGSAAPMTTPQFAVDGWAAEQACWTPGTIGGTEQCDQNCYLSLHSDGCGHYTQIVWRNSTEIGCGVSSCVANGFSWDIWICNYAPAGNIVGQKPY